MDNVTHSIIGLGVAEVALQLRMKDRLGLNSALRPFYWVSSVIGNNIPDIDVPVIRALGGERLDFLLQHRGYTHSIGALLPFTIVTVFLCFFIALIRHIEWQKKDWIWLTALSFFGVICHVVADSWNSYGVHPLWPLQNKWYYGDAIFILEPWIWITLIPCLLYSSLPKFLRGILLLFYAGILGAAWKISYVPLPIALLLTVVALLGLCTKTLTPIKRLYYSFSLLFIVLLGFTVVSHQTKKELAARFAAINPDNKQNDLILSPLPANPFCWNYISVETNAKEYILRSGVFAPFSDFFPVEACPIMIEGERVAPLEGIGSSFPGELLSLGTFRAELADFRELDQNCYFSAFRHFARAPFWIRSGATITMGDLRFDNGKRGGFSTLKIPTNPGMNCPKNIPPWEFPLSL